MEFNRRNETIWGKYWLWKMLVCDVGNLGSSKTMEALGGKLERIEIDPYDGILTSVYWINGEESLEKYKDKYVDFIDKSYENNFMK